MFDIVLVKKEKKGKEKGTSTERFVKAVSFAYAQQVGEYVLAEEAARTTPLTKAQACIEQAEAFVRTESKRNRLAKACRDVNRIADWNQKPVKQEALSGAVTTPKKWAEVLEEKCKVQEFEPFEV